MAAKKYGKQCGCCGPGGAAPPSDPPGKRVLKALLSILALAGLAALPILTRRYGNRLDIPEINSGTSDAMIFIVGLLTGVHCVGMCGGFLIGYTSKDAEQGRSPFRSHLSYGAGKTLSYALLGGLFGFAGSLFRITPLVGGISIGLAGVFLILYGLKMLSLFPALNAVRTGRPASVTHDATETGRHSRSPFFIGFFSGFLLGCGPLQAIYLMAAGNGDPLAGAKFLTLFGLGTLPALFGFGLVARVLSDTMTRRFIQASGMILVVMGGMMLNSGFVRAGAGAGAGIDPVKPPSCCGSRK